MSNFAFRGWNADIQNGQTTEANQRSMAWIASSSVSERKTSVFWKKKTPDSKPALPLLSSGGELTPRSARDAGARLLAILAVVGRTHENPPNDIRRWARDNSIAEHLSPNEAAYFASTDPSADAKVAFSWRAECAASLLWALGGMEEFPPLHELFSVYDNAMVREALLAPASFLDSCKLREFSRLQEQEDCLYQAHWKVRDAQLFRREIPKELHPGIVYERRYALSWLVGWGKSWDEVPTDT